MRSFTSNFKTLLSNDIKSSVVGDFNLRVINWDAPVVIDAMVIQVIDCHSKLTLNENNGNPTDVIYLDNTKTFDRVIHSKLLLKLSAYHGINNHRFAA